MRLIRIASRSSGTNDPKYVKRISFVSIRYCGGTADTGNRISRRSRDFPLPGDSRPFDYTLMNESSRRSLPSRIGETVAGDLRARNIVLFTRRISLAGRNA